LRSFLIEYDRRDPRLVRIEDYGEDRERAFQARLEAELAAMAAQLDREIVILESERIEVLHRTHASYFETPDDLLANFRDVMAADLRRQS
jgi:hypothetical protein